MRFRQWVQELFYPSAIKCVACGDELPRPDKFMVCSRCKQPRNLSYCSVCGRPMPPDSGVCGACYHHPDAFIKARSCFAYDGRAAKLVKRFKYGGHRYLAECMSEFMADTYFETGMDCSLVTFVPLHAKRLRVRGFNQAQLLAVQLSKRISVPVAPLLKKTAHTKNMAKLGRADRARLIAGTFALDGSTDLRGKTILLVDDVLTTGATANECANVLLKAHAGDVSVLTYASVRTKERLIFDEQSDEPRANKRLRKIQKNSHR